MSYDFVFYTFSTACVILLITTIAHLYYKRVRHRKKQADAIHAIAQYLADNPDEINIETIPN